MRTEKLKSTNYLGWILIITVLILLYSSYFLLYIPQQKTLVRERGFRILEEYAQNIHEKKDYYQNHLKNYDVLYAFKDDTTNFFREIQKKDSSKYKDNKKEILRALNGLEKTIKLSNSYKYDSITRENNLKKISYYESGAGGKVVFNLAHNEFSEKQEIEISEGITLKPFDEIKNDIAFIPVSTLMQNLKFDGLFENIAFLDSEHVIYNTNGNVVNSITNFSVLRDSILKTQGGLMQIVEIHGAENHVMFLPVNFLDQEFFLAGFISDRQFSKKTRTINSQLLTIITGILLLILVGMPVLKIVFISHKERLNVRDVNGATISLIFGLSILLLLFIGTMKYYVVDRNTASHRLETISDTLLQNIESDFEELYSLCDTVASCISIENSGFWKDISEFIDDEHKSYITIPDSTLDKNETIFPFNEIIFMNKSGTAVKAVTKTPFTNLYKLDLSSRNYYQKLDQGKSWTWNENNFNGYYIESIKSYNTGNKETAISFGLNQQQNLGKEKAFYMAITSHIPSLYDQILPEDVAFVVINRDGKVLFHSEESKNLHENFLVESNNHPRITGAIKYRTTETVRINYNERTWLARIVPMHEKPFYHVTLLNLQYTDNKNTRIYLFTFYFLFFTFICTVLGIQIIKWTGPEKKFIKSKIWSFNWLIFRNDKHGEYKKLFYIHFAVIGCQILSLFIIKSPVAMLVYQLIFIAFASYASFIVLKENPSPVTKNILKIVILILLIALGSLNFSGLLTVGLILVILILFNKIGLAGSKNQFNKIFTIKQTYQAFMFIWLAGLTIVPVVGYYQSIKLQEEILATRSEMVFEATQNLMLKNEHEEEDNDKWFQRINGSNIDYLKIKVVDNQINCEDKKSYLRKILDYNRADFVYNMLPCPLTKDEYLMALLKNKNVKCEWQFADSMLKYLEPDSKGMVMVESANLNRMQNSPGVITAGINNMGLKLILYFILPVLLLIILIWSTFRYLADFVLTTVLAKWDKPVIPSLRKLIERKSEKRIILISFDGSNYYRIFKRLFKSKNIFPYRIHADEFFKEEIKFVDRTDHPIWITGLEAYLLNFKKADVMLSRLAEINRLAKGHVVLEMPYDIDFIKEYAQEYIADYKVEKEEEIRINDYIRGLSTMLKDYYRYTCTIETQSLSTNLKEVQSLTENINGGSDEGKVLANAHVLKLQYRHIWNCLNQMEKMILFDLADDGMLNFKNKFLINRLVMKGLIKVDPKPEIFDPSFRYFLKYSILQEETQLLERNLSKQGKWKNAKYMLLLLLIPLATFMFISQGASIEKVIGILAGVLALFSGVIRIMDSSWLSTLSKK
ncbi:MAG: hypothetical protein ABFS16_07415 [Bacteroidota bacterium]